MVISRCCFAEDGLYFFVSFRVLFLLIDSCKAFLIIYHVKWRYIKWKLLFIIIIRYSTYSTLIFPPTSEILHLWRCLCRSLRLCLNCLISWREEAAWSRWIIRGRNCCLGLLCNFKVATQVKSFAWRLIRHCNQSHTITYKTGRWSFKVRKTKAWIRLK